MKDEALVRVMEEVGLFRECVEAIPRARGGWDQAASSIGARLPPGP